MTPTRELEMMRKLDGDDFFIDRVRQHCAEGGLSFFRTEMPQTESGEFLRIDYVNDHCPLLTQSAHPAIGVPHEFPSTIARRLAEGAQPWLAEIR